MQGLMMKQELMISDLIEHASKVHRNREIYSRETNGEDFTYTWGECAHRARKLANAMKAAGVKKGDRVATIAWNNHRHMEIYYAVSGIGAIVHTINPRLDSKQLTWMVNHAEDTWVMFDTTFAPIIEGISQTCPKVKKWVAMCDKAEMADYKTDVDCFEDILETGGCFADVIGGGSCDSILGVVPMFHISAWGLVYSAAMVGAKLVMPGPNLDGASLTRMIQEQDVTLMAGVPTVWLGILNHLRESGESLPKVRKALVGGSALPESLLRAYEQELGIAMQQGWCSVSSTQAAVYSVSICGLLMMKAICFLKTAKPLDTCMSAALGSPRATLNPMGMTPLPMMAGSKQATSQPFTLKAIWRSQTVLKTSSNQAGNGLALSRLKMPPWITQRSPWPPVSASNMTNGRNARFSSFKLNPEKPLILMR